MSSASPTSPYTPLSAFQSSSTYPPRNLKPTLRRGRGGGSGGGMGSRSGANGGRRRASTRQAPKDVEGLQARWVLFTYALSRLPPRQLPLLGLYACCIVYASSKGWIPTATVGKAGASIVGVLSMVTGLLLSYRFSSAVTKWEEGKKIWVAVRTNIRDAMRMLSIPSIRPPLYSSPPSSSQPSLISISNPESEVSSPQRIPHNIDTGSGLGRSPPKAALGQDRSPAKGKANDRDIVAERVDEVAGLFVAFAFALQHHLHGTRPLPQQPLCDLLPLGYLSSLKRTEARVRFADEHLSHHSQPLQSPTSPSLQSETEESALSLDDAAIDILRPGLRRRGTGPPSKEERQKVVEQDEWELSNLRMKAEDAVAKLAEAVAGSGSTAAEDLELRQQLNQLNIPSINGESGSDGDEGMSGYGLRTPTGSRSGMDSRGVGPSHGANGVSPLSPSGKPRSNLANPYPANLPLTILKLLEAYIVGLTEVPVEKGGWTEGKRDRALGIVKALTDQLGEAERLASTIPHSFWVTVTFENADNPAPPPLPLTLHLTHLLSIYLAAIPLSLLCAVSGPALILITLLAGWCLLGLEALVGEVGGVFGGSENHHPLPLLTNRVLMESLDISPSFFAFYRSRVASRLGEGDGEVGVLERRRKGEEWLPSFS